MQVGRFRISENGVLITLSVILGLSTGAAVLLFRQAIGWFHYLFTDVIGEHGAVGHVLEMLHLDPRLSIVLTLTLAGLLVGAIIHTFVGHEKYHGVAAIMESVALAGGRLRYKLVPFKALASALSLGAGASVGPEDPSVQIGSNLGSFFGNALRLSEERRKLLVAGGAASAIAAAFNAPIAGVFFALEIILGEFTTASVGVVVLSAVISAGFTQYFGGATPVFGNLEYALGSPIQLPFYVLLGLILAFVSSGAIRFFHWQADFWHHRINLPLPIETAITGGLVGTVALFIPQIMFHEGETVMHDILSGHDAEYTIWFLLLLGLAKLVMTAISTGGGFVGGVFAPTLFIGIVFGSAYGRILNEFASTQAVGNPQSYAIAGMAGLLAGVVRAPITAILLVFELTDDYSLILPIMLTSIVCVLIIERLGPAGIYMWSLIKNGLHIQQGRDVDVMQGVHVHEAMMQSAPQIAETASLRQLRDAYRQYHTRAVCVVDDGGRLKGIVTLGDLQRAFEETMRDNTAKDVDELQVCDICTADVVTVQHDEPLWAAIQRMGARDIGRLPVIDKRSGQLVGLLRRQDIMQAYNTAVARKLHDQHYAEQIRLNTLTGAHVLEYKVEKASTVIDKHLNEVQWPAEAVVASILRRGKLIVPHGDTQLKSGDTVTVVANTDAEPILEMLFSRSLTSSE